MQAQPCLQEIFLEFPNFNFVHLTGRGGVATDYVAVLFLRLQRLSDAPLNPLHYSETTTFLPTL